MTDPSPHPADQLLADHLAATRAGYDAIADEYAQAFADGLEARPLDRAMLAAYAEIVRDPGGPVADVGCGPGQVTAHLHDLAVPVYGVDLSPAMVALARATFPGLRFEQGSMTALDVADAELGGLVAWYSLIHVPPARHSQVLAEFARALAPGGHLLLAFQIGDQPLHFDAAFGHAVNLDFHRLDPDRVAADLADAGFALQARMIREPDTADRSAKVPQAFLIARAPAAT